MNIYVFIILKRFNMLSIVAMHLYSLYNVTVTVFGVVCPLMYVNQSVPVLMSEHSLKTDQHFSENHSTKHTIEQEVLL